MPNDHKPWLRVLVVGFAGALLGYQFFGLPGLALWAPAGAMLVLLLRFLGGRLPRTAVAVPLIVAVLAFAHASTLGWGGADAPDGTRYKASPIGLVHVLQPRQAVSPVQACRWYFDDRRHPPCTWQGDSAINRGALLLVFPLLMLAITACLVAIATTARRAWPAPVSQRRLPLVAASAALAALWLFSQAAARALAGLAGLEFGTGGSLGMMEMTLATLLCLAVAAAEPT